MNLIRHLPDSADCARAVAIGNFDGLHLGHQAVIAASRQAAQAGDLVPSVLTFEPHPRRFFARDIADFRIMRLRDKLAGLAEAGVEDVVMPRFDAAFASMSAATFLEQVLGRRLGAKVVITGENFAFGHRRAGTLRMLKDWGAVNGVEVITVPPVVASDGVICSSSAVRAAIAAGDMRQAKTLLGHPYRISGRVVHGAKRGRDIGFPTANILPAPGLLLPLYGVYAVKASFEGHQVGGVANVGLRPTAGSYSQAVFEAHLFDIDAIMYGKFVECELFEFIRPEMKFDGLDTLKLQIAKDCEMAKTILGKRS